MMIKRRRGITADEDIMIDEVAEDVADDAGAVDVAPEASDLLFEAEDVAELIAEVTGDEVAVTADEDQVIFEVGDAEYTVIPEGDEETVESATRIARSKRRVAASRRTGARRPVSASRRIPATKPARKSVRVGRK